VSRIAEYRQVAPQGTVDIIERLAERVSGRRFVHVSGGRVGGGPAQVLRTAVPILNDLGIDTSWEVTGGDSAYYATVRALQTALEGTERVFTPEGVDHYLEMNRLNARKLDLGADLVVVHDVQPASLVTERAAGRWVWRCHFDCSTPQHGGWTFFRPLVNQFDAAVFSLPQYARRLEVPAYILHPSIDPLSDRNRDLPPRELAAVLASLRVAQDKPLLVQVGPLTRGHDPLGVVNAYRIVKKHHDVRLVLAGAAEDDPDSREVVADLREAARGDADITVLELPADAHIQINALQRAATIVLQKSVQEGFELGAAEAMWKGKPVIGGTTSGLAQQILHDVTGYLVRSVEGAAFRIRHLLNNHEQIPRMGAAGREHARRAFLVTRHLLDYLALMVHLAP
jgi:trehalose synthase